MSHRSQKFTPYLPTNNGGLSDLCLNVYRKSASLGSRLHPITKKAMVEFLRLTNSYYSNLIEGHYTRPVDIERAIRNDFSPDPAVRNRQIEARVHVEVQRQIGENLNEVRICGPEFICMVHRLFYERLPKDLRIVRNEDTGQERDVFPGLYRSAMVKVGRHIPPDPEDIPALMERFFEVYTPAAFSGTDRLMAAAAAHHRLAWIHPFLDGNGRVARLFTDGYLALAGLDSYGLWTISRGFARHRDRYVQFLADAEAPRQGDLDGRGQLTQGGLDRFCLFFGQTCLDQITFMESLLDIDGMVDRFKGYIELRNQKMIPGTSRIKPEAFYLLKEAFFTGQFARGQSARITGLGQRTAQQVVSQLVSEGILVSDTPKGPVRLGFCTDSAAYWLPDLLTPESGRPHG